MSEIRKIIEQRLDQAKATLEMEKEEEDRLRARLRACVEEQARTQLRIIEFEDFLSGTILSETEGIQP
jgi:hypothetical protein